MYTQKNGSDGNSMSGCEGKEKEFCFKRKNDVNENIQNQELEEYLDSLKNTVYRDMKIRK